MVIIIYCWNRYINIKESINNYKLKQLKLNNVKIHKRKEKKVPFVLKSIESSHCRTRNFQKTFQLKQTTFPV